MTFENRTIIVADGDDATRVFLADNLCADGYDVLTATSVAEVRARAERGPVALLVLGDFGALGASVALLREVRSGDGLHGQVDPSLPVVMLSGDAGELAVLRCLEAGADDVLGKPFSYPQLRARIASVLRRASGPSERVGFRVGELEVDRASRQVRVRGTLVELTAMEFTLLAALASEPSRVVTKHELLARRVGLPGYRDDARAGLARLPPAAQARRPWRHFVVNVWAVG